MKEAIDTASAAAPILAIILFALPAYVGVLRQKGLLRGLIILMALGLFAIAFDVLVTKSGLPYAGFTYADSLGYKVLGTTPWTVGFVYPPLVLAAFWMASKLSKGGLHVLLTGFFLVFIAIVLSPAVVKLELWTTEAAGGQFYGVPYVNLAGLLVSGIVSGWLLNKLWGDERARPSIAYSGLALLLFWTGVNIGVEQWIPVSAGTLGSLILLVVLILEKRQLKKEKAK